MDRTSLEPYVGKNIELWLMPDGRRTIIGVLVKCEEQHIVLNNGSMWGYPLILGFQPAEGGTQIPIEVEAPAAVPEKSVPLKKEEEKIKFQEDLEKIFEDLQKTLETFTLNADYVRRFRPKGQNKILSVIESILTKYQYAVKAHEDRPYSMRMRELVENAYHLWKNNKTSIAASEIYAFTLYLTGESEKSVKLYMRIHDFHGAFMAASTAASKILSAACIAISENLTPEKFAVFFKLEPPQLTAILILVLDNVIIKGENKESEFNNAAAIACKVLGFNDWENGEILFCDENIKALRDWLSTRPADDKIISDALKILSKDSILKQEENFQKIDWTTQRFEGEFEFFNPNRDKLYGFIKCPILKKYGVTLSNENSIFVHFNQIQDRQLRQKLLLGKKMHPDIRVTFKLGNNVMGPAASEVREKNEADAVLKINMQSALSEEGKIDFYRRHDAIPFGKVRTKNGELFTFNELNIADPLLMVFLEYEPSPEGFPVRFTRSSLDNEKVQIHNIEPAVNFPENKIKAWQDGGLIDKARQKMNLVSNTTEEIKIDEKDFNPEIEELLERDYISLSPYSPGENRNQNFVSEKKSSAHSNKNGVETFNELPKFLQDKILSVTIAGKCNTEFLGDNFYRRGHYREVKATYLELLSRFNNDDSVSNAERAERYFLIARYVYNFFSLADEADINLYSAADEDNIKIMAYKGLEYMIYDQFDAAKKNDEHYDTARRYCLIRIADEIQTARRIDAENTWFKIYIFSYFVNGLHFHSKSGKYSPQDISLKGSSLLECNDFAKFFDGLLALAYVTEPSMLTPTLRALLFNPEYAAFLIEKLGISYKDGDILPELQSGFKAAVD
ncbi:MAG: hypothetical protein IJ597_02305 [Synergistaceae bacterium]|nr:hypothetical protein [Synergistaceae bacterium]